MADHSSIQRFDPKSVIEGLVLWEYRGMPMVRAVSWVFLGGGGADSVPETP